MGWEIVLKKNPAITIEQKISIYENISKERLMLVAKNIFKADNTFLVIAGEIGKLTKKEIKRIIEENL
jgi:hypothetical protein